MFQETVEAKNVRFSVTFQDFDTYYVIADDIRLCQVLTNLVSNAVKFTAKGEITVTFQKMLQECFNTEVGQRRTKEYRGKITLLYTVHIQFIAGTV